MKQTQDEQLEEIDEPGSSVQKEKSGRGTDSPDDLDADEDADEVDEADDEDDAPEKPATLDEHGVLQPLDQSGSD